MAIQGISITPLTLYVEEMKLDYPLFIGDGRDDMKGFYRPLIGFPTTILVDRDDNSCHSHSGYTPKAQFEAKILSFLELNP